jgi:cytochrome c5
MNRIAMKRIIRAGTALCVLGLLAACGSGGGSASAAVAPPPPASPAVQKIFDTTCRSCHGVPASGAPQAGDGKAWAPRIAQGRDTVLGHIINGYKGMPPMGLCMQCSEDDFAAVTEWMSGGKLK